MSYEIDHFVRHIPVGFFSNSNTLYAKSITFSIDLMAETVNTGFCVNILNFVCQIR